MERPVRQCVTEVSARGRCGEVVSSEQAGTEQRHGTVTTRRTGRGRDGVGRDGTGRDGAGWGGAGQGRPGVRPRTAEARQVPV